jgi:hypothetical protein
MGLVLLLPAVLKRWPLQSLLSPLPSFFHSHFWLATPISCDTLLLPFSYTSNHLFCFTPFTTDEGSSTFLWNAGNHKPDCNVPHPSTPRVLTFAAVSISHLM